MILQSHFVTMKVHLAVFLLAFAAVLADVPNQKIVGGDIVTNIADYPYILSVWFRAQPVVTAVSVSSLWALSSAATLNSIMSEGNINFDEFMVLSDAVHLLDMQAVPHPVTTIALHPLYRSGIRDYDIALIQVDVTDPFQDYLMYADTLPPTTTPLTALAWGQRSMDDEEPYSVNLQSVVLERKTQTACQDLYFQSTEKPVFSDRIVCALNNTANLCVEDWGGPLIGGGRLIGVAAWWATCGSTTYPSVFTHVGSPDILQWIQSEANIWRTNLEEDSKTSNDADEMK